MSRPSMSRARQIAEYDAAMKLRNEQIHTPPDPVVRPAQPPPRPPDAARSVVPPHTLARSTDVETSKAAAHSGGEAWGAQRIRCLQAHAANPAGMTDDEVAVWVGEATWRRTADLRGRGWIEWLIVDGEPVTRRARSGRQGRVCVLTAAGREQLA